MASFFGLIKKIFGGDLSHTNEETVQQETSTRAEAANDQLSEETNATALSEPQEVLEEVVQPDMSQQRVIARTDRGRFVMEKAYNHLEPKHPVSSAEDNQPSQIDGSDVDKIEE